MMIINFKTGDPIIYRVLKIAKKEKLEIRANGYREFNIVIDDIFYEIRECTPNDKTINQLKIYNTSGNSRGTSLKSTYEISDFYWNSMKNMIKKIEKAKIIDKRKEDIDNLKELTRTTKKYNL